MFSIKKILQEKEDAVEIKSVVTAYEEIASMKMRRIRGNVLGNRDFIMDLAEIYKQLLNSYRNQILHLIEEKKMKHLDMLSVREHNEKTACVFISANSGLFGTILQKTYQQFANYIQENEVEPVILGEFGKTLFMKQFPDRKFLFFPIVEKENPELIGKKITETLIAYKNIILFYAKFESMVSQKVALLDVSGQEKKLVDENASHVYYYFEPSLEKILDFFEREIFVNILGQTFTESDLARYASRMITLDTVTQNIENRLKSIEREKRIAIHRRMNKKQIESITGVSLWKLT